MTVSHLQYADDTIFSIEGIEPNTKAVKWLLLFFEVLSGLSVNFDKSYVYGINLEGETLGRMAGELGCRVGELPILYLGMKVGGGLMELQRGQMWWKG